MTLRSSLHIPLAFFLCETPPAQGLRTYGARRHVVSVFEEQIRELTAQAKCPTLPFGAESQRFEAPEEPNVPSLPYATSLPVYYITNGGGREENFLKLFKGFSPQLVRVPGVDGTNLSAIRELVTRPDATVEKLRAGHVSGSVVGCMLAHMQAIRQAYLSKAEVVLVLEDDAVPLTPLWPMALEEFALGLPGKWQAVQMHWTANTQVNGGNFSDLLDAKRSQQSRLFQMDSGWGTAAYLISRAGMRKLVSGVWNWSQSKFTVLDLLERCRKFSADDCLLGFSDTSNGKTKKEIKRAVRLKESRTFRATPPYFLHGSVRRKSHRINLCLDVLAASAPRELPRPLMRTGDARHRQLLLFVPETFGKSTKTLMLNIKHARLTAGEGCCDVFPAFRSEPKGAGVAGLDMFELLRQHYRSFGKVWREAYDYIWVLEPDMDITKEDVHQVLQAVREAGATVAEPLVSSGKDKYCFNKSIACAYQLRDSMNLSAPLIRTDAVPTLLGKIKTGRIDLHRSSQLLICNVSAGPATPHQVMTALHLEPLHSANESGKLNGTSVVRSAMGVKEDLLRCMSLKAKVLRR